ncbi:MAG: glycosyltransferase [Gammaproteobacteria bacterium]|nr:glycosyltransferase [Gammaproteobacteria bacterium]
MSDPSSKRAPADRLSVTVVIGSLDVGGTERHIVDTISRLDRERFDPVIYLFGNRGPLADTAARAGVTIVEGPMTRRSFSWLPRPFRGGVSLAVTVAHLALYLRRSRPDICHCFLPLSCILVAISAKLCRFKTLVASRRSLNNYQRGRPLTTRVERWAMRSMRVVMANSRAIERQLIAEGVSAGRIRVIYNGLDLHRLRCDAGRDASRAELGLRPDTLVIIVVANLIPYKGHADLFAGLAGVADRLPPDWCLLCVGRDDGIQRDLQTLADSSGIGGHVRFLGMRMDVGCLFRAADIAVSCSHQEGFSNSIIEAMACGLPVVATDVGGSAEAVADGVSGIIVESGKPVQLGAAVLKLAGDEALRLACARAGQAKASKVYAIEEVVHSYEEIYRTVAGDTPAFRQSPAHRGRAG